MLEKVAANAASHAVTLTLGSGWGWKEHRLGETVISFKGYVFDGSRTLEDASAARHVAATLSQPGDAGTLKANLRALSGHFAFVLETPGRIVASVDRIRSIPLFHGSRDGTLHLDDRATRLRDRLSRGGGHILTEQVLAAAMSGYTIGNASLYRGLEALGPGEALVFDANGSRTLRWFLYDAWRTEEVPAAARRLSELNRFIIERLAASAGGRPICVPLSAGYDSRFIAAGLKSAGARDVRLFSYGRPGNHEIETAKAIADRLGYPWRMVPFTTGTQRAVFADPAHEDGLWGAADSCCSVPFEQDWRAIDVLKGDGFIPRDAIIVNGQTGDFISGNHAPPHLMTPVEKESADARRARVLDSFLAKHFRLWRSLATPGNDGVLRKLLMKEADAAGVRFGPDEALHGIHEMLEYQNRQAKYVVSGQRTYEAHGLAWRLPLWDDEYIEFWRRAPAHLKQSQNLYRRVLEGDNWAGVFQDIPVNRETIRPHWIRPLRAATKLASAPLGAVRWHAIERRVFGWWMDPLRGSAVVPYHKALLDGRGARHGVAWLVERWLAKHGVALAALEGGER